MSRSNRQARVLHSFAAVYPPLQAKTRALAAALILSVNLMLALHTKPAYACSPPVGGFLQYTVGDRTSAAEVVLEGTVADVSPDGNVFDSATVEVHQYFKGSGPATVEISGFGQESLCLSEVRIGDRLIFYANLNQSGELSAHYLRLSTDAVDPADTKTILEVMAAVGQDRLGFLQTGPGPGPVTQPSPPPETPSVGDTTLSPSAAAFAGIVGLSIVIGGGLLIRHRSKA